MVAAKFTSDHFYSNVRYAKVKITRAIDLLNLFFFFFFLMDVPAALTSFQL